MKLLSLPELKLTPLPKEDELGRGLFALAEDAVFRVGADTFVVPTGFVTDGASIPRWARWALPEWGRCGAPALLHDFLLQQPGVPKWAADLCFLAALRENGVPELRATLMYVAVRIRKPG